MKKKISVVLVAMLIAFGFILNASVVKADSGFDFSYDSSSSSDYSSDSYTDGEPFDIHNPVHVGVLIFVITFIVVIIGASIYQSVNEDKIKAKKIANAKEALNKYNINYADLINELSNDYVDIQKAWMNFDYESLKSLLTDELYNTYVNQLETLKIKNEKNIMENIKVKETNLLYVKEENDYIVVTASLKVEQTDYIVNNNGEVTRGSKLDLNEVEYTITFVKPLSIKDTKCPNCGANLNGVTSGKCPSCRTTIILNQNKFVMSKKTIINQRRI